MFCVALRGCMIPWRKRLPKSIFFFLFQSIFGKFREQSLWLEVYVPLCFGTTEGGGGMNGKTHDIDTDIVTNRLNWPWGRLGEKWRLNLNSEVIFYKCQSKQLPKKGVWSCEQLSPIKVNFVTKFWHAYWKELWKGIYMREKNAETKGYLFRVLQFEW